LPNDANGSSTPADAVSVDDVDGANRLDQRLIFPVGHRVDQRRVRRGATVHELTERQLATWLAAHESSDTAPDPELIGLGLLAPIAPEADQALEFARTHRLVPLMLGLGNAVDDPSMYAIGFRGQAFVQVDPTVYDLWHWSATDDTIWATCQSAADVASRSTGEDRDPHALLNTLLESLHLLLTRNAACLDIDFRLSSPKAA
jgi:hypothetical protein